MSASRSHSMQLCQSKLFTPIPKFIVSYLARFFYRFQHVLGLEPTRKILSEGVMECKAQQAPRRRGY